MQFVKAHGAGNDFVMLSDLEDTLVLTPAFVAAVCDRHTGVGADGLIRITRPAASSDVDFFMDYYNADGAVAEMCGNGIRCLAKYVVDRDLALGPRLEIATRAGVKSLTVFRGDDGLVDRVRVDMGAPILARAQIPMRGEGDPIHEPLATSAGIFDAACVSMGNPHCVLFLDDLTAVPFTQLGPEIETSDPFPARTNVEFAQVLSTTEVRMRVWERGVGETQACGTGACATAVAASLRGLTARDVAIHLPGGTLMIEWATDDRVFMTGPAAETFEGVLHHDLTDLLGAHHASLARSKG